MEISDLKERFGKVIQRRRRLAKMGQEKLAHISEIHRTTLSLLERGKHLPNLEMVHRLAVALGVKMAVLVSEAEDWETPLTEAPTLPKGKKPKSKTAPGIDENEVNRPE